MFRNDILEFMYVCVYKRRFDNGLVIFIFRMLMRCISKIEMIYF